MKYLLIDSISATPQGDSSMVGVPFTGTLGGAVSFAYNNDFTGTLGGAVLFAYNNDFAGV